MEEEPVGVPERETKNDFIISDMNNGMRKDAPNTYREDGIAKENARNNDRQWPEKQDKEDEFDLSDIYIKNKGESYEEIIAAAEASAFTENWFIRNVLSGDCR